MQNHLTVATLGVEWNVHPIGDAQACLPHHRKGILRPGNLIFHDWVVVFM